MPSPFVYMQLHTQNHDQAKDFYTKLFGWKLTDSPPGAPTYTEIDVGEGTPGGMMPASSADVPSHWLPFVQVDDVDASTSKAATLGAHIIVQPTDVPTKGRYSVVRDVTGAALALWTPIQS